VLNNLTERPWGFLFPALAIAGLIAAWRFTGLDDLTAFLSSCAYLLGMLTSVVFGLYPYVLPASTNPAYSLTVYNAKAPDYGLKVGLPAYAATGVVAWRMMDDGDHWASDVVFGATLGWVVGHTVARRQGDLEIAGFEVMPYTGNYQNPGVGISLAKRF